ncbi:type II toxin-antitoxin system Phd/YefM family antitoxin [Williamsia sp. M5A3_1d]
MTDTVPIAALRQNPAPALQAVSEGRSLVVTSHNRPVADLVPHREIRGATPAEVMDVLVRTPVGASWAAELADDRAQATDDPWA